MISLMLQSCGTATNVGIQTWKGKEKRGLLQLCLFRRGDYGNEVLCLL